MNNRFNVHVFKQALSALGLALLLVACGGGGGDDGGPPAASELYGTWDVMELEALAIIQPCPGEIALSPTEAVSCGTTFMTFNADGSYISVDTTDDLGNPFNERTEGTWSTSGNALTITETMQGPDAATLVPINPIEPRTLAWSVSANSLTITLDDPLLGPPVTSRLQKR